MSIKLKNDWKATGNNPTARRMADWMNKVSDLFNFASVPSGGTAQPTERGFQIEVDSAESPFVFDVKIIDDNSDGVPDAIQVYGNTGGTKMAYLVGAPLVCSTAAISARTSPGYATINTSLLGAMTDGDAVDVYFRIALGGVPADITSTETVRWEVVAVDSATQYTDAFSKSRVIARISLSGTQYTVTQLVRGAQSINARYTDSENYAKLGSNDAYKTRSISDRNGDGSYGSLMLYDFRNNTPPEAPAPFTNVTIVVRSLESDGITYIRYLSPIALYEWIGGQLSQIHNELEQIQGGDALNRWHLTLNQWTAVDGAVEGTSIIHRLLGGLDADDHPQYFKRDGRTPATDNDITVVTKITDTTAAATAGTAALVVDGGVYAAKGVAAEKSTAMAAGDFRDGLKVALLGLDVAGRFYSTIDDGVDLGDGTYGVNAGLINASTAYYHNGTQGVTGDGFSGGIKVDAASATTSTILASELYT